jgi:hypothetical protein
MQSSALNKWEKPEYSGIEDIMNSNQCGMPKTHLVALAEVANKLNQPIIIRPISIYALHFLEKGYPTKPFVVKNKTSKTGPMAGLIPMDVRFSRLKSTKLENALRQEEIIKYNNNIAQAEKKDNCLKPTNLYLTRTRIETLCNVFKVMLFYENKEDASLNLEWINNDEVFYGKAVYNAEKEIYAIFENLENPKPIQVLGRLLDDGQVLPLTSDYDLFLVPPAFSEFDPGNQDKTPYRTQGHSSETLYHGMDSLPLETPNRGNISPRLVFFLDIFNNAIARKDDLRQYTEDKKIEEKLLEKEKIKSFWKEINPNFYIIGLHSEIDNNELKLDILETLEFPTLIKYIDSEKKSEQYFFYQLQKNGKMEKTPINAEVVKDINFNEKFYDVLPDSALHSVLKYKEYIRLSSIKSNIYTEDHRISIKKGLEVIQHGQEINNPFAASLKENLPLLAIFPASISPAAISEVYLATTPSQVRWIWSSLRENGFYLSTHTQYHSFLPTFRATITDEDFKVVKKTINKKMEQAKFSVEIDPVKLEEKIKEYTEKQNLSSEDIHHLHQMRETFLLFKPLPKKREDDKSIMLDKEKPHPEAKLNMGK